MYESADPSNVTINVNVKLCHQLWEEKGRKVVLQQPVCLVLAFRLLIFAVYWPLLPCMLAFCILLVVSKVRTTCDTIDETWATVRERGAIRYFYLI